MYQKAAQAPTTRTHGNSVVLYATALLVFAVLFLFIPARTYADTRYYANDLLAYTTSGATEKLWEFGHLLWRPAGYVTWNIAQPILARLYPGDTWAQMLAAFASLTFVSGAGVAVTIVAIGRALGLRPLKAVSLTIVVLCFNAVLLWTPSGSAYIPGFLCQLASVYFILHARRTGSAATVWPVAAGVTLALSVLIWFPFMLSAPGIVLFALLWSSATSVRSSLRDRWRFTLAIGATAAALVCGVYAVGAAVAGVHSISEFVAWVKESSHGMQQNRGALRIVTGLPRGFIDMGNDGMILKRYVLRDPYAPVSLADVLRLSLWKLPLIYAAFVALAWKMYRSRERWSILLPAVVAAIPVLLFAMFVFESSSPERYLPMTTLLVPAVALTIRDFHMNGKLDRLASALLAGFAVAMIAVNISNYAFAGEGRASSSGRMTLLHHNIALNSKVVLVSPLDEITKFYTQYAFDPLSRSTQLPIYSLTVPGMPFDAIEGFSKISRATWGAGGEIWVTKRLWVARPRPEWEWVEGDNPTMRWAPIHEFFKRLETSRQIGGDDGFVLIPASPHNLQILPPPK